MGEGSFVMKRPAFEVVKRKDEVGNVKAETG